MALIEVQNLRKTYTFGRGVLTEALRGVDLSIESGEFLAIAGPSGSGKSSLLNIMGGLDTPSSGAVIHNGEDITGRPIRDLAGFRLRHIGFVFQAYNLINTLTALENVEYIMLLQGRDARARRQQATQVLARVGLADYLHRFPYEMSGGQQQRVAVARAMAAEPAVILADEPTANLDSKTAESLLGLMLELNQEKGMTFIFSTHDQMIMRMARRLVLLKDGVIAS